MALRNQIPESAATFSPPYLGINLRAGDEQLRDGEARLMQNCEMYGNLRIRRGSTRLNSSSFGAYKILGGHKYYYGGAVPTGKRLIAYNNKISVVSNNGVETNLTSGMTAGLDTFFTTWSITDSCYIGNKTDTLRKYDGTTFSTVSGTAIPVARTGVCPILDRLMAITTNGIERTNPRVDNVWSSNSSWATLRPIFPGLFTHLYPITMRGTDTFYPGILAFQERAHYLITGTNFGSDVTAGTSTTDDASIKLLDGTVGTASPYSVTYVPGIGMFWFTADLNVYWLPEGSLTGKYVGDRIQSTVTTSGIEDTNAAQLSQVWMTYWDHMLMLSIPTGSAAYATTQFWMDMRSLRTNPDRGPVWYGPMTGQSVGRTWVENQQGDNNLYGGEGNSATGAFIYTLRNTDRFTDAVGTADNGIEMVYQTPYKNFGTPSREKYVQAVHFDLNDFAGTATCDLLDFDGSLASDLPIEEVDD